MNTKHIGTISFLLGIIVVQEYLAKVNEKNFERLKRRHQIMFTYVEKAVYGQATEADMEKLHTDAKFLQLMEDNGL